MGKSQSKLTPEQLSDLQRHTHFDKRELQQWYQGFIMDCPEGRLDKKDFGKIYSQFFPFGDPGEFADYVFDVFDENKNGYIDFKEFICALSATSRGTPEEKLRWAFQLYDINKDGHITYQEMFQIVQAIYKMTGQMLKLPENEETPEKRVDKIFKNMNKDKNSRISYSEFVECSKQDPTVMDALSLYDGLV
ncbi:EF-hand [Russula dissimulans]|nr:EF-hand [Russula dissimulans]